MAVPPVGYRVSVATRRCSSSPGRYGEHRRWMIRSFSPIMAGVMLRVWTPIYDVLAAVGIVDFPFETAYAAIPGCAGSRTCCSRSGYPPPRGDEAGVSRWLFRAH